MSRGRARTSRSARWPRRRGRRPPVVTTAVRDDAVLADRRPGSIARLLDARVCREGNARLASRGLAEEIERLRAEPGEGHIAIGGATLAAEVAASGLIDEYRARVYPVLVGGGIPFFPRHERRVDLELLDTRTFSSRVVFLRYRVARQP
ncbi:dihydrofolate reductase family protein [Streptomyces sp. NPDC001796]|uniref:dihydrofolate reductase family protein n=1 Tax=Streptomyces sp. NPDC001796 TaxID=3364609 RepID=UPI0036776E88